ncbi:MAG: rane-associated phospholipid phosphatase [Massilia sp.]|nr:rane-associated phospholipid phosphatase [Massilia sp.]
MPWFNLMHIGDIELTSALAAAITVWLLATRAWRMAYWWSLLFTVGIGLVGASKVASIAWGMTLHGLDFKAVSGHATGVTAVYPTLFYLLLRRRGAHGQAAGVAAGLILGALMGVLLVVANEHSLSEALAGWMTGAAVSLGAIRMAGALPPGRAGSHGLLCSTLAFMSATWLMHAVPHGYLMFRTAAMLSRNLAPLAWGAAVN